jgi:hypothetical protein
MGWVFHHLGNHSLHDSDVSVESTTNKARKQRNPETTSHAKDDAGHGNAKQADQSDRFPAINI